MTPAEFDSATPREVQLRLEALDQADADAWQRTAQLAAWVLGSFGAKLTADDLLGKPKPQVFTF